MDEQQRSTIRAAAYLAEQQRHDRRPALSTRTGKTRRGVECNPPNKKCGNRCIPPNWDCRLEGKGTNSELTVHRSDPLAGIASIQRGAKSVTQGIVRANPAQIQRGRKALILGAVKLAPGDNLEQKKQLRRKLEEYSSPVGAVLGVATLGLAVHMGLKRGFPAYRQGFGRGLDESASNALQWGLDRTPFVGQARRANRRMGSVEAQRLARAVARGTRFNPADPGLNDPYFPAVSLSPRGGFTGLDTAIKTAYADNHNSNYAQFRSNIMAATIGATDEKGKSLYAEAATSHFLARRFGMDPAQLVNKDGVESRFHLQNRLSAALTVTRTHLRADMGARGLDPSNEDHIQRYTALALGEARPRLRGLSGEQLSNAEAQFTGYLRDLTFRGNTLTNEVSTRRMAREIYDNTESTFDQYFKGLSRTVRENTAPTTRVIASGNAGDAVRTALIGTANRLRRDVGLGNSMPLTGANAAELVLQKVFHERVVPGSYVAARRSTWLATSDSDLRYAAQDMGWTGTDIDSAVEFLRSNGFGRIARRPAASSRAVSRSTSQPTGSTRAARRRQRSRAEIISMLRRAGRTEQAAENEADRIIAQRGDVDDTGLPPRLRAYLETRADFKEGQRLGKPCGASHIPKAHECRKGQREASSTPEAGRSHLGRKLALTALVTVVGAIGVTVALDAHRFYNAKDLPNPPSYREAIRAAQAGDPKVSYDIAIGRHYDKVVEQENWKVGELVYTRYGSGSTKQDPTGHFAVYMGKQGDRHQFADFGVADAKSRAGMINLYEYGPGVKGVAPFIFVKAPPLKRGTTPYTPEEVQQRVFASLGARLKYDALDNNCETWARMITTGQARSSQVERLSTVTRSIYRYYDRKTAGASPKELPSVKQQARILDLQAKAFSGDKSARTELKAFEALIKSGKRTDGMQQDTESELPSPAALLADVTSDAEAVVRTKLYLMLLIRLGEARAYGPA